MTSNTEQLREAIAEAARHLERIEEAMSAPVSDPDRSAPGFDYPTSRAPQEVQDAKVEEVWEDFWAPLFAEVDATPPTGLNGRDEHLEAWERFLTQVKGELYDASFYMDSIAEVAYHVTGGAISKPNTMPSEIKSRADEHVDQMTRYAAQDWLEFIEPAIEEDTPAADVLQSFRHHFGISVDVTVDHGGPFPPERRYEVPADPFVEVAELSAEED